MGYDVWLILRNARQHRAGRSLRQRRAQRGQTLVMITVLLAVLLGLMGLVIDSGYAYSERRQIQNAADSSALNGARDLDAQIANGNLTGADTQVLRAIKQYIFNFNLTVNKSGNSPASLRNAVYINQDGTQTYGNVGSASGDHIPVSATGVRVVVQEPWTPFLIGILGFGAFSITATSAAASGVIPGADAVFLNCPGAQDLTIGGSSNDVINGSVFVNGDVQVNGGLTVNGSFGASGSIKGTVVATGGGPYSNQPAQQFPAPDVADPVDVNANLLSPNPYSPSNNYPEFDQEAYWSFYLGYNLNTLPLQGQSGQPPLSTSTTQADMYFEINHVADGKTTLGQEYVSLASVLAQIPDTQAAPYANAYAQHYNTFFKQWVQTTATSSLLGPGSAFPSWLHWVDTATPATQSDPTTWFTLTPTVALVGLTNQLVFIMNKTTFPVSDFAGKCPTGTKCWPSGIWWAINWASYQCSGSVKAPCIDMTDSDVAWVSPGGTFYSENTPSAGNFVGITIMTNVALTYGKSTKHQSLHGWGYASAAALHPAEAVYYGGWGALGTLYVPRSVIYTTYQEPLPNPCSAGNVPEAIHFDGSDQHVNGFVMAPYGLITFNGGGASDFNGEIFAAQLTLNGTGVMLTYDTKSAAKGDPLLIQ